MGVLDDLRREGFTLAPERDRILCSTEGLDKTGKNNFAFTFPDPIGVLDFDRGQEGMIKKFRKQGKVIVNLNERSLMPNNTSNDKAEWESKFTYMWECWRKALASRTLKTLVVDTASDVWDLTQLAIVGKTENIAQLQRTQLNKVFRQFVREVYESDKNLVLIHRVGKDYVEKETVNSQGKKSVSAVWTGGYKRKGFNEVGYLVQANFVQEWREDIVENGDNLTGFLMTLTNSRTKGDMQGYQWMGADINYEQVYTDLFAEE